MRCRNRQAGHVGAAAIRRAWFGLVLPALLLNYFGQGALLLSDPQAIETNPDGRFQLFRVGDAVASRNIHAAIYDARRLALTI